MSALVPSNFRSGVVRVAAPFLSVLVVMASLTVSTMAEGTKPFRSARLTFTQGDVHVEVAKSTSPATAVVNMPLVEGSVLSTGEDGQAEIEFEDGSVVRLTPNSGVSLLNLSVDSSGDYQTRVALLGGLAYLELRAGTKFQYSVDAGGDVISPVENSTIRVNFDEPPAVVAVLDGTAHIVSAAGGTDADVRAGQTVRSDAASEGGMYMIKQAIAPESWDQWNEDRDQAAANEGSSQTDERSKFAGDQGYGWSDLDANGSWYDVPGQGQVWQPNVADLGDAGQDQSAGDGGFDPYSYGSWSYTPAGYTWASGYGWGWLPYRCGQWSYWPGFGWGWSPGIACGSFGFGGYGYGGVNIGVGPVWYRHPHRPIIGPGPVHPILRGRGGPTPVGPVHGIQFEHQVRTKTIAGNTVEPLQPIGGGYTPRGGSAVGSALQRDYPVDRATHEPVSGLVAAHGTPVPSSNARVAWQPANQVNRGGITVGVRPVYSGGAPRQGYQPVNGGSPGAGRQTYAPTSRPAPVAAPRQSAPASAPRAAPAAPASHPSSSGGSPHK